MNTEEKENRFERIYDEIVEELRGNLSNNEYRELITLEYVMSQGYDKSGDFERYKELIDKKYQRTKQNLFTSTKKIQSVNQTNTSFSSRTIK